MPDVFVHVTDLLSRYLHIACTTILVGGTLFYEMVVPAAIEELKTEQQLDVFGRARIVFKRLVWISAILLVVSGVVTTRKQWRAYSQAEVSSGGVVVEAPAGRESPSVLHRPGWWWVAHASTGALAVVIALYLTTVTRPPDHPIGWMRLNLVILLVVIFLGSATRHVRLVNEDPRNNVRVPFVVPEPSE